MQYTGIRSITISKSEDGTLRVDVRQSESIREPDLDTFEIDLAMDTIRDIVERAEAQSYFNAAQHPQFAKAALAEGVETEDDMRKLVRERSSKMKQAQRISKISKNGMMH